MIITNEAYIKYVLDDIKNNKGLFHPVKSPAIFRLRPIKVDPRKLHPNPEDEFSMESVGPNWDIIGNYEKSIRHNLTHNLDMFDDPLMAVRLDKGGLMILNGHHRWMACINLRIPQIPVKIVNITMDDDVYKIISKSKRDKCITIDLDEVLFVTDENEDNSDIPFPQNLIYKKNIRTHASLLIREFQRLGYDVWIYTGSYMSEQYIRGLFLINNCSVDGIVNGLDGKKNPKKLREIFRTKYSTILHVDNETLTIVNPKTKKYEILDINAGSEGWASAAVSLASSFDMSALND